jgi:hypothetical protein
MVGITLRPHRAGAVIGVVNRRVSADAGAASSKSEAVSRGCGVFGSSSVNRQRSSGEGEMIQGGEGDGREGPRIGASSSQDVPGEESTPRGPKADFHPWLGESSDEDEDGLEEIEARERAGERVEDWGPDFW